MATTRIGINGFGRMGRLALRAAWGWSDFEFAHINELHGDTETAAHLLTFDSVHGRWARDVRGGEERAEHRRPAAQLQRPRRAGSGAVG